MKLEYKNMKIKIKRFGDADEDMNIIGVENASEEL